jgi:hypothetical protein
MTPLGPGREIAHDYLAVAVLRDERVSEELSVAGKRLPLNAPPTVIVGVGQRPLLSGLLREYGRGKKEG